MHWNLKYGTWHHKKVLTLSLPRMINFKFLLQPHHKCYTTQYQELGFPSLTQMKDDYTVNSHYLTYTFLFKRLGECPFWTYGSERVKSCTWISSPLFYSTIAQNDEFEHRFHNSSPRSLTLSLPSSKSTFSQPSSREMYGWGSENW